MSARTSLIVAGASALGIFAILMLYAVSGTSDAAYEAQVRRIVLQKAGSRAGEVKFYRLEDITAGAMNEKARQHGIRAIAVQFHGAPLERQHEHFSGKFGDFQALFLFDGKAVQVAEERMR